ncbi:hypothetical protein Tco_0621202, partial [Tanacetum coccineum]
MAEPPPWRFGWWQFDGDGGLAVAD